MADGKMKPGEIFTSSYGPGNLTKFGKKVWDGEEKLVSPVHIIGSFAFSMRVNPDGKSFTIGVYDRKTFSSGLYNRVDPSINKSRDSNEKGNQPLTSQFIRFIWTQ